MRKIIVAENEDAVRLFDYLCAYKNRICNTGLFASSVEASPIKVEEDSLTISVLPTPEIEAPLVQTKQ